MPRISGLGPLSVGDGERIVVTGRVLDGSDGPVSDAIVEVWQADSDGEYRNGWGRAACDDRGKFRFDTVKPGRVRNSDDKLMAPSSNSLDCCTRHQYRSAHPLVLWGRGGGEQC